MTQKGIDNFEVLTEMATKNLTDCFIKHKIRVHSNSNISRLNTTTTVDVISFSVISLISSVYPLRSCSKFGKCKGIFRHESNKKQGLTPRCVCLQNSIKVVCKCLLQFQATRGNTIGFAKPLLI